MKLWRENDLKQEWYLPNNELISLFKQTNLFKNKEELEYIGEERMLRRFIGSPAEYEEEGLDSTFDEEDFKKLFREYLVSNIESE